MGTPSGSARPPSGTRSRNVPFLELQPFGVTDAGKVRQNNEDALLVGEGEDETLFVVADGIGGFEAGEVASSLAVDVLKDLQPDEPFKAAIGEANRRIVAAGRSDEKLSGMGTTVVAIRFGGTQREPVAEVATAILPIEAGDRVLLCSAGLSDMVSEAGVSEILADSPDDPERAAHLLLSAALDAGGNDNITIVIVDVKEQPAPDVRERRERRSGGTSEMVALGPSGQGVEARTRPRARPRRSTKAARRNRSRGFWKGLGKLVRGLAIILVLVAALTPAYLWGSSRYFFEFDEGEVVAYQGLPYAPLGIELNQEWRRPGLTESEIKEPYQKPIENHKLYTRDQAERVIEDLGS